MACSYSYNGITYSKKKDLEVAVLEDLNAAKISAPRAALEHVYKLRGDLAETVVRIEAEKVFGSDEFLTTILDQVTGEKYIVFDERLMNEQVGNIKEFRDENNKKVDVNIEDLYEKWKGGQSMPNYRGLESALKIKLFDEIIESKTQKAIQPRTQESKADLMETLTQFAASLGIDVMTMENYKRTFEDRHNIPVTAKGLADMFNQVIALSNDATVADFTEEVAHFTIQYYQDRGAIDEMLEQVPNTTLYQAQAEQYRQLYSKRAEGEALEQLVRKEILGKLLAERIIQNTNPQTSTQEEASILNLLSQLWEAFKSLFVRTDANAKFFADFGSVLDSISYNVSRQETGKFAAYQSNEVYYSASTRDQELQDNFSAFLDNLRGVYTALSRATNKQYSTQKRNKLGEVAELIAKAEYIKAIHASALSILQDAQRANEIIRVAQAKMEENNETDPSALLKYMGVVNTQNLILFKENIPVLLEQLGDYLTQIQEEYREGNTLGNITLDDINRVRETLNAIEVTLAAKSLTGEAFSKVYGSIALEKTKMIAKEMLEETSSPDKVRQEMVKLVANNFEDISWFNTNVYSMYETGGHSGIQAILGLYLRAMEKVRARTDRVYSEMVDLSVKHNLTIAETRKLMKDGFMLNPWKIRKYKEDEEAAREVIVQKYMAELAQLKEDDPNRLVKETNILQRQREELLQHDMKWREMPFKEEFYRDLVKRKTGENSLTRSNERRPEAQEMISSYSASVRRIMSKYYDKSTGKVIYGRISAADESELRQIYSDIKAMQSYYDSSGQLKSDLALAIAEDIRDYFSFSGDTEISPEAMARFEAERVEAERTLSAREYQTWLQAFAYQRYQIDYETSEVEVNTDATDIILSTRGNPSDYLDLMTRDLVLEKTVNGQVVIQKLNRFSDYQDIYDALRQKRNQLLKPYRVSNVAGEIDGTAVEANILLVNQLEVIADFMSTFAVEYGDRSVEMTPVGNKSFQAEYQRRLSNRASNPRAYQEWYRVNVKGRDIFGKPLPSKSYYTAYIPMKNGQPMEMVASPKFLWEMTTQSTDNLNPNYNQELAQKGVIQPNLNLKEYLDDDYFRIFGISKNDIYSKSPTSNQSLFEVRNYFLNLKYEEDQSMGLRGRYSYYQLPQVRRYFRESAFRGANYQSFLNRTFVIDSYDEDFGNKSRSNVAANARAIPLYFTKLMENPNELTEDIGYMYMSYVQMAANYREKGQIVNDISLLRDRIAGAKDKKLQPLTNTLKKVDMWLDSFMYGNSQVDLGSFSVLGKRISNTKLLKAFYRWVSNTNLAYNIYVPVVGAVTGTTQRRALSTTNRFFGQDSLNWAISKSGIHVPGMFLEAGKLQQKNIGDSLLVFSGVGNRYQKMRGIFTDRATRSALRTQPGYLVYEIFTKTNAVNTVAAVYDAHRLYNDPQTGKARFVNKMQFKELMDIELGPNADPVEIKNRWVALRPKSFYNYLKPTETTMEVNEEALVKDGLEASSINGAVARINRVAENAHNFVEGQTSAEERGLLSKNPFGAFLFMHRGFLQRGVEHRFKKKNYDWFTGTEDEGVYRGAYRMFTQDAFKKGNGFEGILSLASYMFTVGQTADALNRNVELDESDKSALRKIGADMYVTLAMFALYLQMNLLAGDDDSEDDWATQYLAYISSRTFLESTSTSIFAGRELLNIANSPTAGTNTFKTLLGLPTFFIDANKEVTKGAYAGKSKLFKNFVKMTPFKNIYEPLMDTPAGANAFFRQNAIPSLPREILAKKLKDEK